MGKWADRKKNPKYGLLMRQNAATFGLADEIQRAMALRGVRQADLSSRLSKTRAWVSKLLNGDQNLTVFTIVEVADALNFDVSFNLVPRIELHSIQQVSLDVNRETSTVTRFTPELRICA